MFGEYTVHCRPKLRSFLTSLAENFYIGIWTRLPFAVAIPVVEFLFRDMECFKHMPVLTMEDCFSIMERQP